jgi:hypothetical protein
MMKYSLDGMLDSFIQLRGTCSGRRAYEMHMKFLLKLLAWEIAVIHIDIVVFIPRFRSVA